MALTAFAGCVQDAGTVDPPADVKEIVPFVAPLIPKIDAKMMLENHEKFVTTFHYRAENAPTHIGARLDMAKELEAAGLEVYVQKFKSGIDQENICAVKMGVVEPAIWVVVGAHYDTTTWDAIAMGSDAPNGQTSQGAYDDGSGTRITIELAKAYANIDTYYSILFCAFDGEERGTQGSGALIKAMADSSVFPYDVEATRGMIDFDMMGICYPVRAPIQFDWYSDAVYDQVNGKRKEMGIPDDMFTNWQDAKPQLGSSDYGHWVKAKVPTAFFISNFEGIGVPTPVEQGVTPATPVVPYPFWHFQDTVETMEAMAGGPEMLQKGFQTALDLGAWTLDMMANHPEIVLDGAAPAA